MRILLIHWYYPPQIGGVETIMRGMAETLADRGHNVTVYAAKVDDQKDNDYPGLKIIRDSNFNPALDENIQSLEILKETLTQELKNHDILLSQNMSIDLAYNQTKLLYNLAQTLGVPHIDHMHCDNSTPQGVELLNHPWKKCILGVSDFHRDNMQRLMQPDNPTPVLTLYNGTNTQVYNPATASTQVLNLPILEPLIDKFRTLGVLDGQTGITVKAIQNYFRTQGWQDTEKLIVCSARLVNPDGKPTYRKGIDVLLKALRRLLETYPDDRWKVILTAPRSYGSTDRDYEERDQLLGAFGDDLEILQANQKVIYFPPGGGFVPIFMLLEAADIYCQPSKAEPFGLVFIEAMAMQKVTVGADNGAIPEIITHGETGFLIKNQQDDEELADRLHQVLNLDEQQTQAIGQAARRDVISRFSIETMMDKLEEYITQAS